MTGFSNVVTATLQVINEVIQLRQFSSPTPMYADHPNWNRRKTLTLFPVDFILWLNCVRTSWVICMKKIAWWVVMS